MRPARHGHPLHWGGGVGGHIREAAGRSKIGRWWFTLPIFFLAPPPNLAAFSPAWGVRSFGLPSPRLARPPAQWVGAASVSGMALSLFCPSLIPWQAWINPLGA